MKHNPADIFMEKMKRISPEVLGKFLDHKKTTSHCVFCGTHESMSSSLMSEMTIPPTPEEECINLTYVQYYCIKPLETFSIIDYEYRLICNHCGFVHRLSAFTVQYWLDNKNNKAENLE